MLHSRVPSPKLNNNKQSVELSNTVNRSKSSISYTNLPTKLQKLQKNSSIKQFKSFIRVQSAFKKKLQQGRQSVLPKVSATPVKGKLYLGKNVKPDIILSNQIRHNPWAAPSSLTENIINKKGLMDIINMGMVPKCADFTQLLNNKYEQKQQKKQQQLPNKDDNFFATNPIIQQKQPEQPQKQIIQQQNKKQYVIQQSENKKPKKKIKKGTSSKKSRKQIIIPQQPQIFQILNQKIQKNQKYYEFLKKIKKNDDQVTFKYFVKKVEQFAFKHNLKKFQFKLVLDQTRKISDSLIKQQIINARVLGISLTLKGSVKDRASDVAKMLVARFRFKRSKKDLQKIQNLKRYFKIKRYYQQMTQKRCDFLKFKLGSFAQRQRRLVQEAQQKPGINENFQTQIHLISISGINYQQQRSYYKIQCRNNIQLTRLFSQQPQHLIILTNQSFANLAPWLKLIKKIKGYHPNIQIITSELQGYKVKGIDSIYYGINEQIIKKIRKLSNKQNTCLYPNSLNFTIVKLCETLNSKLFSSNFWKPYLSKLLEQDEQKAYEPSFIENYINTIEIQSMQKVHQKQQLSKSESPFTISEDLIKSTVNFKQNKLFTQTQIKHLIQKARTKQLNMYQLTGQYFSNKLNIKKLIFNQFKSETPLSVIFQPQTNQKTVLEKLTQIILQNKNVNKWVFKIGGKQRFSRQLAYLETDSLKILKQKKKKSIITLLDFEEVAKIIKVILLDKLQLPQNSLYDSNQFLSRFFKLGGYVQSVIVDTTTECVFCKITPAGKIQIQGTYSKIYTDQGVNCAGIYPSNSIKKNHISSIVQLIEKMQKNYQIFGHITFQLLIQKTTNKHYFIDMLLCLQQYSSLYFMYRSLLNNINNQSESLNVLKKYKKLDQSQKEVGMSVSINKKKVQLNRPRQNQSQLQLKQNKKMQKNKQKLEFVKLNKFIVYIPFIDNNGNTYKSFSQFQDGLSLKSLITQLDYENAEGLQFLYLNLKQQMPDVLSLVSFSDSQKKALKYAVDGLNFLVESGQRTNKFDKKVERRKYDCLYIHDIIWKIRQIKKSKDSLIPQFQKKK